MLKNRKEDIERMAIEMFEKIDMENVWNYTDVCANLSIGDETIIGNEFNELASSIRNTVIFAENLDATATGILNASVTMLAYAAALYYKSDDFESDIDALNDCVDIIKTIDSKLELIKDKVWGYKNHTKLIETINKEKSSLIANMNFSNESKETENSIINSLFA